MNYNFIYIFNSKMNQYHYILTISLLIITVLLSTVVYSSVNALETTSKKIDTNSLSDLAPKPSKISNIIDSKALDNLMQPSSEQIQNEKSNNILSSSSEDINTSPSPSNFKTATIYEFVKKWGSKGTGDGQFQRVHDLDFDPTEKYLYTIDRDGNRVQVFDKDGNFIKKWGSKGTGDGQFTVPYSVDVDSKGDVWVADRGNHRIQKFDKDGNFLFQVRFFWF